ncbi:Hypothetical predicted protein [Paramuricea clavata]|uniref:Uncharacterized protein n=1 Tax=Paramuricea clavata TaxID=317549 RepID=A0A6S7GCA4_PARCT|nr:Hypothetical predicted protein [Paramuricea clavata]
MSTEKTKEVCGGVVKAHSLINKSPMQHAADLQMLEEKSEFKSAFCDKQVEYVHVDGGSVEALSNKEIYAFAARIPSEQDKKAFSAMDVTDGSTEPATVGFLNTNTETLSEMGRRPCYTKQGLDKEQLAKKLELAMDVYIKKVNGTPLMLVKVAKTSKVAHLSRWQENREAGPERERCDTVQLL